MNTASYVTLRKLVHPGQQQQQCSLIDSEVPPSPVKLMEPLPLQVTSEGRQSTTTFSTQSLVCQPCMFTNSYHYRWPYPPTPIQRSTQEISFGMSCSLIPSIFPPLQNFCDYPSIYRSLLEVSSKDWVLSSRLKCLLYYWRWWSHCLCKSVLKVNNG